MSLTAILAVEISASLLLLDYVSAAITYAKLGVAKAPFKPLTLLSKYSAMSCHMRMSTIILFSYNSIFLTSESPNLWLRESYLGKCAL